MLRTTALALCCATLAGCKPSTPTTPEPVPAPPPPAAAAAPAPKADPAPAALHAPALPGAAASTPSMPAAPPLTDAQWIDLLLNDLENSPDRFIRNGTEYSGKEAADHLRSKLRTAGARIKTREDFLTGLATTSSMSGKPYMVKRADGTTVTAREWFDADIVRIKAGSK